MSLWKAIARHIADSTQRPYRSTGHDAVGGGCINSAYRLHGDDDYFVKTNSAARSAMFEAEAAGLREIAGAQAIRVPMPICWGVHGDTSYLVLENLELGAGGAGSMARFGQQLAAMHQVTRAEYGWQRDNTIGSTPQLNTPGADSWEAFWRVNRLGFQLELAARNGHRGKLQHDGQALLERLGDVLDGHRPPASLLHGDLWSGNYAIDRQGNPVIYDPAVYYGDRETDLAMTELFGSFGSRFYAAYDDAFPLADGYPVRRTLYNLYHVLNHLNLFGGGYRSQAEHMIASLLSEVR